MQAKHFIEILRVASKLKEELRHCYLPSGRQESVAEHSWMLSLMVLLLKDEFPDIDINKVIKMGLIHDLGEAFIGDIAVFQKTDKDRENEDQHLRIWLNNLPSSIQNEFQSLYDEMEERKSLESKLFKALDGLEALIQHNFSDIETWSQEEFDFNLHYADDRVGFSPFLSNLREVIRQDTLDKITNYKPKQ